MNAALSVALRAWSAAKDGDLVDLVRRLNLGCVMAYPPLCPAAAFGCSLPRLPSARPGRELVLSNSRMTLRLILAAIILASRSTAARDASRLFQLASELSRAAFVSSFMARLLRSGR